MIPSNLGLLILLIANLIKSLTPCIRVLLEKLTVTQLVKKFSALCRTRRSITVFLRSRSLSLSWARWIQSTISNPISLRYIWILSSHVHPDLQVVSSLQVFRPKFCVLRVTFRNVLSFYGEEMLAPANPQPGEPPLVGFPRLLIQYICIHPLYLDALYLQPEDAPCHGKWKVVPVLN